MTEIVKPFFYLFPILIGEKNKRRVVSDAVIGFLSNNIDEAFKAY